MSMGDGRFNGEVEIPAEALLKATPRGSCVATTSCMIPQIVPLRRTRHSTTATAEGWETALFLFERTKGRPLPLRRFK